MVDFEEMARRAKAAADSAEADKRRQDAEASATRDQKFKDAAAALLGNILPLLEEARAGFKSAGVTCVIGDNWRGQPYQPMRPELTFQCVGEKTRNSHGGTYQTMSPKIFASFDGDNYRIGKSDSAYSNHIGSDAKTSAKFDAADMTGYLQGALEAYLSSDAKSAGY